MAWKRWKEGRLWEDSLSRDKISALRVPRSPERRLLHALRPSSNSHGAGSQCRGTSPSPIYQEPTRHQEPTLPPRFWNLISLSPNYFSPIDGSLFEGITHTTYLYVYWIFSSCDGIPDRVNGWRRGWLTSLHTWREERPAPRAKARLREREVSGLTLPSQGQRAPSVRLASSFSVSLGSQPTARCVITYQYLPFSGRCICKILKTTPRCLLFWIHTKSDDTDNYHHALPWLVSARRSHTQDMQRLLVAPQHIQVAKGTNYVLSNNLSFSTYKRM